VRCLASGLADLDAPAKENGDAETLPKTTIRPGKWVGKQG